LECAGEQTESVVLGNHGAGGVRDSASEVEDFIDDGTHAGSCQNGAHLARDREHLIANDFLRKRVRHEATRKSAAVAGAQKRSESMLVKKSQNEHLMQPDDFSLDGYSDEAFLFPAE
jgi:hypothetical protein